MAHHDAFRLTAGAITDEQQFRVAEFRGREGTSRLFQFDIRGFCKQDLRPSSGAPPIAPGSAATFSFEKTGGTIRAIHGVVARIRLLGQSTRDGQEFSLRLVPVLWLSRFRVASRVFQDMTIPEVVTSILRTSDTNKVAIPFELKLHSRYPKRPYCVQHKESDFDFIKRILAEEGIYFYFAHTDARRSPFAHDAIVLQDNDDYPHVRSAVSASAPPLLVVLDRGDPVMSASLSAPAADDLTATFEGMDRAVPELVRLGDYDFQRPLVDLQTTAPTALAAPPSTGAHQAYPRTIHHPHGEYADIDVSAERARAQLEQYHTRKRIGRGTSSFRALLPGYDIRIDVQSVHAACSTVLDGTYAVTDVWHRGTIPELMPVPAASTTGARPPSTYENRFECIPSNVKARPKRPTRRPIHVLESATVVGPASEEIYVDEFGRIRVQFHWDLEGDRNEHSTTWLRVAQPWAGTAFGLQAVPRIGTEVLVSFLYGDQDIPIVIGAVHNATHPAPFRMPEHKTRSGFRTRSTPGGMGYNELSFEDLAGREQIFLRAQKDLDEEVCGNHTQTVAHSQTVDVRETQTNLVGGMQIERILGSAERSVEKDETVHVKGGRLEITGGNARTEVEHDLKFSVRGSESHHVMGTSSVHSAGDATLRGEGNVATLVGTHDAKRSHVTHVQGMAEHFSTGLTEFVSPTGFRFRSGNSTIEITPERIELSSDLIQVRSTGSRLLIQGNDALLSGQTSASVMGQSAQIAGAGASLKLRSDASLAGTMVYIQPSASETDTLETPTIEPTRIELTDQDGRPIPNQRYVLVMEDGSELSGFVDHEGRAEVWCIEQPADVRFPGLLNAHTR